ncbi:MAG: hypothetical protein H7Z14_12575 [Anaerolineae bacterium]|nr:hypothetical protein [Phycisphaerae bacterium]
MNRALCLCVSVVLWCGIVGCHNAKVGTYAECALSGISSVHEQLISTEVGTRIGNDGRPTTGVGPGTTSFTIARLIAGGPAYYALIRSTYDAADPIQKAQAQYVTSGTQSTYPFLNIDDGTSYVVGDKPAAQTEHIAAGSESTAFIIEVDHNGEPTDDKKWIHRVYVLEVKDHVCVWAQQALNAPKPTYGKKVKKDEFVESTFKDNRWVLSEPKTFVGITPREKAVTDAKAVANSAGL